MLAVRVVCCGRLREKHYIEAMREYEKRLGALCRFEVCELPEQRLGDSPSRAEIDAALEREAALIEKQIEPGAYVWAMCVEGRALSSEELAGEIAGLAVRGRSRLCFIIGSSFGLAGRIKRMSDERLSMSRMTFPHHLARVMLTEQIYRAFMINSGSKYHK